MRSISACFEKQSEYPKIPIDLGFNKKEPKEYTKEEIELGRKQLLTSLKVMESNFKRTHK